MRLLLAEDERALSKALTAILERNNYSVDAVYDGQSALDYLEADNYDGVVLDIMMPKVDGLTVLRKVRERGNLIPILLLTAKSEVDDKVEGLDAGASDYLAKPFHSKELLARIRVAFRHYYKGTAAKEQTSFEVGGLKLDLHKRAVFLEGKVLHLTPMEYQLLALLFKNMGRVLTTSYIIKEIWGEGYGRDTQALRALMAALRRKIEKTPANPRYILTEIGVGYRLVDE